MKVVVLKDEFVDDFESDVERIRKIFIDRGYKISHQVARNAWQLFSSSYGSKWLLMAEEADNFIFKTVLEYCRVIGDDDDEVDQKPT